MCDILSDITILLEILHPLPGVDERRVSLPGIEPEEGRFRRRHSACQT